MIATTDLTMMLTILLVGMFTLGLYMGYKLRKFVEKHTS
jgi:hypothetical protein